MKNLNTILLSQQELENYTGGGLSTETTISTLIEIVPFGDPINRYDDEINQNFESINNTGFGI
ncbi:hypothetical protein J8L88_02595 [Aquimarina sp. MMG015]|uniref:hypothetical protein n=1 Tax=Aquimarina sp. MMG015 TaxID=2822689 RepID=UPI001B39F573|nr:hypothetical protein [Aquimarina sp. MMG015]MBQ4801725.1 hypothetical protein [Aquimarina sp. MMG015]